MRRTLLAAITVSALLAGCAPDRRFVAAVDAQAKVILPQYKSYVAADPGLDGASKRIRLENAEAFARLIETAKGE